MHQGPKHLESNFDNIPHQALIKLKAIKVRTFTLELLTSIASILNDAHVTSSLMVLKSRIVSFWNDRICSTADSHDDALMDKYHELLITLKDDLTGYTGGRELTEKIQRVLQNHLEIVKLQTPHLLEHQRKVIKGIDNTVEMETNMRRLGLLSDNAYQVKIRAEEKNLNFNLMLDLPQPHRVLNIFGLRDTINRIEPNYRDAISWLFQHLNVISFKTLCQSVRKACAQLVPQLAQYQKYNVLTVTDKSQAWMAHLAMRFLSPEHLPENLIPIGRAGGLNQQFCKIVASLEQAVDKNFVIFDDSSYSGKQLCDMLSAIERGLSFGHGSFLDDKGATPKRFDTPVNFHIVVGCMSYCAYKHVQNYINISELSEKYNIHVKLECQYIFDDIMTLMRKEKVPDHLKMDIIKVCEGIDYPGVDEVIQRKLTLFRKTTTVCEWKRPDGFSTVAPVSSGFLSLNRFRSINCQEKTPIASTSEAFPGAIPVRDIIPPYRKNRLL